MIVYLCIEGITKVKKVLYSKHLFFTELLCKDKTCWDFHFGTENPLKVEVTRYSNTLGVIDARTVGRFRMPVFDSLLTKLSQVFVTNNCSCSKPSLLPYPSHPSPLLPPFPPPSSGEPFWLEPWAGQGQGIACLWVRLDFGTLFFSFFLLIFLLFLFFILLCLSSVFLFLFV